VVLADGVQRIGEVAADLIRYTDTRVGEQIPVVAPGVIGALPAVDTLPVTTFPEHGGVTDAPVVCARWHADPAGEVSHTAVLVGQSVPATGAVTLAQADADGPAVDAVALPAGRNAFVCSVGLTGGGQGTGSLFLVTDSGVLFGIRDGETARSLGLTVSAQPAPWPVLAALPRGPELSQSGASVLRDGIVAAP
jgi:type VII secretion protein EccB